MRPDACRERDEPGKANESRSRRIELVDLRGTDRDPQLSSRPAEVAAIHRVERQRPLDGAIMVVMHVPEVVV